MPILKAITRTPRRRKLALIAVLLVVAITTYWAWGVMGAAEARLIAREAGIPDSPEALAPPPVPPADDPEPQLAVVAEWLGDAQPFEKGQALLWPYPTKPVPLLDPGEADQRRALLAEFEAPWKRQLMNKIETLATYTGYARNVRWQRQGWHYAPLKQMVYGLCIRAWLRADTGDTTGAVDDLVRALTISHMLRQPRDWVVMSLYVWLDEMITSTIQSIVVHVGADAFSADDLQRLIDALDSHRHAPDDPSIRYMIANYHLKCTEVLDGLRSGDINPLDDGAPTVGTRVLSFLASPALNHMKLWYARNHAESLATADIPLYAPNHRADPPKTSFLYYVLSVPVLLDIQDIKHTYALHDGIIVANITGLRLLIAAKQGNGFPDFLPADAPPDPLTNQPMRYEREPDGFRIWCYIGKEDDRSAEFRYAPQYEPPPAPPRPEVWIPPGIGDADNGHDTTP